MPATKLDGAARDAALAAMTETGWALVDGREAVQFLVAVKDALEDPARLLLQV